MLADTWSASTETMTLIHQLNKHFVMPVRSNRKVALSLAAKQQGNYQRVSSLVLEADTVIEVYLEQFDFPLLLAKPVFTNEAGQEGVLYLVKGDVTLDYAAITTLYQRRWSVETFHKSLKSNASLAKSPAKTSRTQLLGRSLEAPYLQGCARVIAPSTLSSSWSVSAFSARSTISRSLRRILRPAAASSQDVRRTQGAGLSQSLASPFDFAQGKPFRRAKAFAV
ncbi:MAG: transposase [Truepera sp.]|nr:transposase [Truepera sp.]